jgi:quercetin dioxygenase-like cupin family protein
MPGTGEFTLNSEDLGSGYRSSPRPEYGGPTLIHEADVTRHMWGDDESGRVDDSIYLSNRNLHALVFTLPSGKSFVHSQDYRTVFGADEVFVVLEGDFALANPETGEVVRLLAGEAVFFRKDTWHHGFNLGEGPARVLEFFAPPPSMGTSGAYARTRPYLPRDRWRYSSDDMNATWPSVPEVTEVHRTLVKLAARDLLLELRGTGGKSIVGYYASTEYLRAGRLEIPSGCRLPAESHLGDELIYLDEGSLSLHLPDLRGEQLSELGPRDGMYIPAGAAHEYRNLSGKSVVAYFAEAPTTHKAT